MTDRNSSTSKSCAVVDWPAEEQVEWFQIGDGKDSRMPHDEWERFYVTSTRHRGMCCQSCLTDEEVNGWANFDDKCCCRDDEKLPQDQPE
jgi:hypothetical protein